MKGTFALKDLERSGKGGKTRYSTRLADDRYELVVAGPPDVLKTCFAEAAIEVEIDPAADKKKWAKQLSAAWKQEREAQEPVASLEDVPALFGKKPPPAPTAAKSGFVSLRQLEPGGTRYFVSITGLFIPIGLSLFFPLPPVCSTFGTVVPTSGDQDLLLHLAWPPIGPIRASFRKGTAVDAITFTAPCFPWTHFAPIWHLFGFGPGVCGRFSFGGTDLFG
jgi:hypothetical protein